MANGSDNLYPTFVGDTTNGWQVFGSGYIYIPPATITNRADTITVQAFPDGASATVTLYESNRNTLTSMNEMLDEEDAAITATISDGNNAILRSPDIVRCKFTAVYVESTGTVEFATSIR